LLLCQKEEKRAALRELEVVQLKELADKHGMSVGATSQEKSEQVCMSMLAFTTFSIFLVLLCYTVFNIEVPCLYRLSYFERNYTDGKCTICGSMVQRNMSTFL